MLDERVAGTLAAASLSFDGSLGVAALVPAPGVSAQTVYGFAFLPEIAREYNVLVGGGDALAVYIYSDGKVGVAKSGLTDLGTVPAFFPQNQWVFFAAVYDGTSIKIYIAGILVGSITVGGVDFSGGYIILGADSAPGNQPIRVKLARVGRLNLALTSDGVAQLHRALGVLPVELQHGSMTPLNASAWEVYAGSGVVTSASGGAFALEVTGSENYAAVRSGPTPVRIVKGRSYRVSGNITTLTAPRVSVGFYSFSLGPGANSLDVTATGQFSGVLTATQSGDFFLNMGIELLGSEAEVSNLAWIPLGALYIQPDADLGAGPVMRGPYGLPDTTLPGDGHVSGGVVRTMAGETGYIYASRSTNGYLIDDRIIIPDGYIITGVWVRTTSPAVALYSDVSGTAGIVEGPDLLSGRWTKLEQTLDQSTTGKVYLGIADPGPTEVLIQIGRA